MILKRYYKVIPFSEHASVVAITETFFKDIKFCIVFGNILHTVTI
jgi:hypothetical protein